MNIIEKILLILIAVCLGALLTLLYFTLAEIKDLEESQPTDYNSFKKGKIGPQKVITYEYGDKYSTYID